MFADQHVNKSLKVSSEEKMLDLFRIILQSLYEHFEPSEFWVNIL